MPAYIAPIETTRSFSVQPAKGLRYGNFEGVVHLPPVTTTTKLGEHSFSTLNNQQIYKTVCEWFEGWRPWQQRVLLCGIVDRCSLRQVDILATTLEPIKHRDYTVAVKHRYPTTPLKKIRDDPSKKKKKKKKLRKKKVVKKEVEVQDLTLSSEQTMEDMLNMEGTETPESVIISIPNFVTREGEKLLEDKLNRLKQQRKKQEKILKEQYEKSLAKVKTDKSEHEAGVNQDNDIKTDDQFDTVDDYAGALAEKIIDDTLSFTVTEQDSLTSSYAQNLAGAILTQAMDNVVDVMTEKENSFKKNVIAKNTHKAETARNEGLAENNMRRSSNVKSKGKEVSEQTQEYNKSLVLSGRKTTSPTRSCGKQVDFKSPFLTARDRPPDVEINTNQDPMRLEKPERQTSFVRIISPKEQQDSKGEDSKRVQSGHSGVSRSLSAVTRSSISKMRYELFGSNLAVSTPDFFRKTDVSKYGTMQRELRQGQVHRPAQLQHIPVPVTRIYKSVKWWPEAPGDGRIYFKAEHTELNLNFQDQLQQVWDWMELWEDYEKIALLKELLKLCGPENLGFLANHIQQQLRDARDMNRLSDKLLLYIFSFLAADEIKLISRVSRRWRFLCARDDLWMIKCHELGLEEGIKNLETMILKSSSKKMGIDWRLAYEELRRITQVMKMGLAKGKKKRGAAKDKAVDFKAEMEQLRKKVTDAALDQASRRGTPQIVELPVHRGTVSAIRKQELQEADTASVISEDLREYDEEYGIKKEELPERRIARFQKSYTKITPRGGEVLSRSETRFDRLQRINTGPVPLRPSLPQQRTAMKDDADIEDAAYDIRPALVPAEDILGKTVPYSKLEWQKNKPKEETVDDEAPYDDDREPNFAGFVKSVLRGRKLQGHMSGILCVQFDHRRLISAGLDRVIRMWDIRSGRSLHKFYGHKGGIRCLQFSGNDLITGSWDTTIMVWDLRNLCRKYILTDHSDSVSCLQFNQDFLVSGSHDTTVRVYRRISYLCCNVIRGHTAPVTGLSFDGSHVISASLDMTLRLSNIITTQCVRVFRGSHEPIIAVTMKGSLIISGDPQGRVHFWNKQTGDCEAAIKAHSEAVHKVAFLDGRFYTASGDGTIREWDLVTMTSVRVLQGHKGPVRDIKVSSDRIVSCSDDGSIRIWDLFDPRKKTSVEMQIRQLHHE